MELTSKNLIHDDHPLIRTRSQAVDLPLSAEDRELLNAMFQFVKDSQDDELCASKDLIPAVGLAAIQVGVPKKMIAVYVAGEAEDGSEDFQYALVNPKIISKSNQMSYLKGGEGCLSVPDPHAGAVVRPYRIKVRGYDLLRDAEVLIEAEDYEAMVLQHEIDHLSGVLYYDRIVENVPASAIVIE